MKGQQLLSFQARLDHWRDIRSWSGILWSQPPPPHCAELMGKLGPAGCPAILAAHYRNNIEVSEPQDRGPRKLRCHKAARTPDDMLTEFTQARRVYAIRIYWRTSRMNRPGLFHSVWHKSSPKPLGGQE